MKIVKAGTNPEPTQFELNNRTLARKAAAEGFVLLENDGILPLKNKKVALYGSGARMTVKGGTGSGQVRERYSVSIAQGLENAGFEITSNDWLDRFDKFYADTYEAYRLEQEEKVKGLREFKDIFRRITPFQHPTGIPVTEADVTASACDTAIYVLARQAGESSDRADTQGDYRLDDVERENLEFVSKNYQNFIVVVNVGGVIDVSFLDSLHVSALVYFVQGGEEGGNALADVLSGKVNFSGKLATSWAHRFEDIPSNTTYSYLGGDKYNQEYNEGIYVGYRYFDTFGVKPRYAFGYGLSYTTFDVGFVSAKAEMGAVTVKAAVTNTGSVAGREVAQLYASVPFGDGAEKQRLVAFAKTKELAPGEAQEVTLNVSLRDLSCYDEAKAAWVLRSGAYILRLGNASDNNAPVAVLTLSEEAILEQCANVCPVQHAIDEIKAPARAEEDVSGLQVLTLDDCIPETAVHTYEKPEEEPDALVESMTDEQLITLVIGGGTSNKNLVVEAMGASGTTTPDLYAELGIPNVILSDGPAGLNLPPQVAELGNDVTKAVKIPMMLEAYRRYLFGFTRMVMLKQMAEPGEGITHYQYATAWPCGQLLAQSFDPELLEQVGDAVGTEMEAYRRYLFGFTRMVMLKQMAEPGEGITHYQYATAWPCGQLLAQSFDPELLEQVGDAVGTEMEAYGVTVWLAPGMNIHRNPLCGRTFEYYSEDPYVSGKMAAAIVRGVQSHPGKGMSVKHFAANNCELMRNYSSSNVSERALREIYLRGFEIAVKESDPMTVMAAYNKINGVYCTNNYDLLVKVLRNEWGYKGLVMSDWDSMKANPGNPVVPVSGDVQKAHMAQCDLVSPGRPDQHEALRQGLETGAVKREDLKRSAVRILKMIRSNTVLESR